MSDFLPEAVRKGLEEARRAAERRSSRLCVHDGDDVYRINRMWDTGFAMDAEAAPKLRGHIKIYDGPRYLYQALVYQSREEEGERLFEYKWHQAVLDAPPVDFVRASEMPAGFITKR